MANLLDGNDLKAIWGVKVLKRPDSFLVPPPLKPTVEHDWPEENGIDKDLLTKAWAAREFTLSCGLKGADITDFKTKLTGLFTNIAYVDAPHTLYLEWLDKTFTIFYKSTANFKVVSKLTAGEVYATFDLILGELDPFDNIEPVYLVDDDGSFLVA